MAEDNHNGVMLDGCRVDRVDIFNRLRALEDFKAYLRGAAAVAALFALVVVCASVTTALYTIRTSEDVAVIKTRLRVVESNGGPNVERR